MIPVFDIGDTLTPARRFSKKFFRQKLEVQGVENPPEYPFESHNEFVADSIQKWLESEGVDADAEEMVENYRDAKEDEMRDREVFETLKQVNKRFENFGVLSDNRIEAKKFFQRLFEKHGIEYETFVVSEEVGAKKPDERIFREFLDRRDVGAEQCVYFGNRGDIDSACEEVGMSFVWVTEHDTFGTSWDRVSIDSVEFEKVERALKEVTG